MRSTRSSSTHRRKTSPKSYCIVFHLGGALARVGEDGTAFSQRDAAHNVNINAVWTEEDPDAERHVAWARAFFAAMQPHAGEPHAGGRVYVNFLGEEGGNRVRQAYGARNYERLVELKRAYDDQLLQAQPEHRALSARGPSLIAEATLSEVTATRTSDGRPVRPH